MGLAVLIVLAVRLGSEPFLAAMRAVGPLALGSAVAVGTVTTLCCAWRWSVVARVLGDTLGVRSALAACYRSQLVNVTTPGGVAGDVLRGVERGRGGGDRLLGLRSVVWERLLGQVVQVGLALGVLLALPSPLPRGVVWVGVAVVVTAAALVVARRRRPGWGGRWTDDARAVLDARVLVHVVPASALVVAALVGLFLVAARVAGSTAPIQTLVPLALVVLLAAAVPVNLAGWGPREGVAAWAFGSTGLGAGTGLTTSVVFGVLVFVATLPGVGVLFWDTARTRVAPRGRTRARARPSLPGAGRG